MGRSFLTIPADQLAECLRGMSETCDTTTNEAYRVIIHTIAVAIATEYFTDSDLEYEDATTMWASKFAEYDIDDDDSDDEDEDSEEESDDESDDD